jgi:hypothetical protein
MWALFGLALLIVAALGIPGLDTTRVSTGVAVWTATAFGIVALIGAGLAWVGAAARRPIAVIGLALPLMAVPIISGSLMEAVAASRSTREMAAAIEDTLQPDTDLMWVESFAPGMSFYLQRVVPLASVDGDELRSNYILRNAEVFLEDAGPLRPLASAEQAVADCTGSQVFLLSIRNREFGDVIEASGVPRLMESRRWMAFGPDCVPMEEARADEIVEEEGAD